MNTSSLRLSSRVARRFQARFDPPKTAFPEEVEPLARKWTAEIEKKGHDLAPWTVKNPERFESMCFRCHIKWDISRGDYGLETANGWHLDWYNIGEREWEWETHTCDMDKKLVRGISMDPKLLGAESLNELLALTQAELLNRLVKHFKTGIGEHWTVEDNAATYQRFAKGFKTKLPWLPVVVHVDFKRSDQPRKYKGIPVAAWGDAGFFEHERETYLGKKETLRLTEIDWYDGSRWIENKLSGMKVKASALP